MGKYSKISLSSKEESQFFQEIKPILEKKYQCDIEVMDKKDSKEKKAIHALSRRPAVITI